MTQDDQPRLTDADVRPRRRDPLPWPPHVPSRDVRRQPPSPPVRASRVRRRDEYEAFANVEARNSLQARVEIPLLIAALRLPRGMRVLEIGCGRGVALPVLARRLAPSLLVGVDVDSALVAVAERRMRGSGVAARLIEADARDLPLSAASFDLVVDFGTCYHVSGGAAGALAALREVARVLAPGGLFVHETPVAQHLAHPVRSFGRALPWGDVPELARERSAILWAARRRHFAIGA